jgi:hypothetical protein
VSVGCVFARPGDPLSAHHDHTACPTALAVRDSRWHPESVVIATRRLIALAATLPEMTCASCGTPVTYDLRDSWVHADDEGRFCEDHSESYLAYPDAAQYAELAEAAWHEDRSALAPFAAARILEEFGLWSDDIGGAYTLLSMLLGTLEPRHLDGMHPLSAVLAGVSRVGADGQASPAAGLAVALTAGERAAESRAIEESNARQDARWRAVGGHP